MLDRIRRTSRAPAAQTLQEDDAAQSLPEYAGHILDDQCGVSVPNSKLQTFFLLKPTKGSFGITIRQQGSMQVMYPTKSTRKSVPVLPSERLGHDASRNRALSEGGVAVQLNKPIDVPFARLYKEVRAAAQGSYVTDIADGASTDHAKRPTRRTFAARVVAAISNKIASFRGR
ncbi:hypothetical protein Bbelb_030280 [Branchiostoma belcheri]|nr:hypothetical protein Bbelb_030280 [Branchiostoma belcheri]